MVKLVYFIFFSHLFLLSCQLEKKNDNLSCIGDELSIANINNDTTQECDISGLWEGKINGIKQKGTLLLTNQKDTTLIFNLYSEDNTISFDLLFKLLPVNKINKPWSELDIETCIGKYKYKLDDKDTYLDCFYYDFKNKEISGIVYTQKAFNKPSLKVEDLHIDTLKFRATTKPLIKKCLYLD